MPHQSRRPAFVQLARTLPGLLRGMGARILHILAILSLTLPNFVGLTEAATLTEDRSAAEARGEARHARAQQEAAVQPVQGFQGCAGRPDTADHQPGVVRPFGTKVQLAVARAECAPLDVVVRSARADRG